MTYYTDKRFYLFATLLMGGLFTLALSLWLANAAHREIAEAGPITVQKAQTPHLDYITAVLKASKTGLSAEEERLLAAVILEESRANSVDPLLVMAIIETESTYYNRARSHKGAIGLMQIMPATGVWVAGMLKVDWKGEPTLYDPLINVRLGTRYFSMLRERFDNNTHISLAAYNAGPTRVSARIKRGRSAPAVYADKVLKNYRELKEDFRDISAESV